MAYHGRYFTHVFRAWSYVIFKQQRGCLSLRKKCEAVTPLLALCPQWPNLFDSKQATFRTLAHSRYHSTSLAGPGILVTVYPILVFNPMTMGEAYENIY
jgi:hypothetical protein